MRVTHEFGSTVRIGWPARRAAIFYHRSASKVPEREAYERGPPAAAALVLNFR
jgi:hypothetical protein